MLMYFTQTKYYDVTQWINDHAQRYYFCFSIKRLLNKVRTYMNELASEFPSLAVLNWYKILDQTRSLGTVRQTDKNDSTERPISWSILPDNTESSEAIFNLGQTSAKNI